MAAASRIPRTRTASTCTPQTVRGTHTFKIAGYSLHNGIGAGKCIQSTTFAVGGYKWCIKYYPDGDGTGKNMDRLQLQAYLELMTKKAEVRAHFDFRLVDHATGKSVPIHPVAIPTLVFKNMGSYKNDKKGISMTRRQLEASSYLLDDCLIIECHVTVIVKEPLVEETVLPESRVRVPPSDLSNNLRKLLEEMKGADVTSKVRGEVFPAHKIILAMRSPVFNAELFGPMADNTDRCINVEDIQPLIFKALLHFIYTDSLLAMEDYDEHEMIRHLLVAADRYAMERLKLTCEDILCKRLNVDNVAGILALAELHHRSISEMLVLNSLPRRTDWIKWWRAKGTCTSNQSLLLLH